MSKNNFYVVFFSINFSNFVDNIFRGVFNEKEIITYSINGSNAI